MISFMAKFASFAREIKIFNKPQEIEDGRRVGVGNQFQTGAAAFHVQRTWPPAALSAGTTREGGENAPGA
jgi:hypothetical protein